MTCVPCTSSDSTRLIAVDPCGTPFEDCDTRALEASISALVTVVNNATAGLAAETAARTAADDSLQSQATNNSTLASSKTKVWPTSSVPPLGPTAGDFWIDSVDGHKLKRFSGTSWVDMGIVSSQLAALTTAVADRLTRSGNLSDLPSASVARTNLQLGSLATQNSNAVNVSGGTISSTAVTNLPAPVNPNDAATKFFVETIAAGIQPKQSVKVATTAHLSSLSTLLTVDGVVLTAGDRVLVKDQSSPSANGIYVAGTGAWVRSVDANTAAGLQKGSYYFVTSGTANGSTGWFIQTAPQTVGVDPVAFTQFSAAQGYLPGAGLDLVGNVFSARIGTDIQAQNANLQAISALSTTAYGRGILDKADANAARLHLGAAASAVALDKTLNLSDVTDAATARANIGALGAANNLSELTNRANARSNLNLRVLNLRDYGAVGDGLANDNTAIASWLAAATDYSVLYAPAGKYRFTSGNFSLPANLNNVTICGDGWSSELFNDTGASGLNTLFVPRTCSHLVIRDLAFTGTSITRANGIHIRLNASYTTIQGCFFQGCSDFGVHVTCDTTDWSAHNTFIGNTVVGVLGDGIHVGQSRDCLIANNYFYNTGDDGIAAVADDTTYVPTRVTIVGNHVYNAGGIGVSGAGIRVAEGIEVLIQGNHIQQTKEAGIKLARYLSTTNYNNRIKVLGNTIWYANTIGGSGGIMAHFTFGSDIIGNTIDENAGGNGISLLDCDDLVISSNTFRDVGMAVYVEQTTSNVNTSWDGLTIVDNVVKYASNSGASAFNLSPASGITINQLTVDGNRARALAGGFIYYDRVSGARITNNTSFGGSIAAGGSVSGVVTANNN